METYAFLKDGQALAHLSGGQRLGTLDVFFCMDVTPEGRRRGYCDLRHGEVVHTPQAGQRALKKVCLPMRDGILYCIILCKEPSSRKGAEQGSLLCLSYAEKTSPYTISDTRGLYKQSAKVRRKPAVGMGTFGRCGTYGEWFPPSITLLWELFEGEDLVQATPEDFIFVISPALHTTPSDYIWKVQSIRRNPHQDVNLIPEDGRVYSMSIASGGARDYDYTDVYGKDIFDPYGIYGLMQSSVLSYKVPNSSNAKAQAKRGLSPQYTPKDPTAKKVCLLLAPPTDHVESLEDNSEHDLESISEYTSEDISEESGEQ